MQTAQFLQIFNPVLSLTINVLTQIFFLRLSPKIGLLKSEFIGFFSGFCVLFLLELMRFSASQPKTWEFIGILIVNISIYCLLEYCYFNFVNIGETARRIRILRELSEKQEGLTWEELAKRYGSQEIIQRRINRLLRSKQIQEKNGLYFIANPFILLIAKGILLSKRIIMGKTSEFD